VSNGKTLVRRRKPSKASLPSRLRPPLPSLSPSLPALSLPPPSLCCSVLVVATCGVDCKVLFCSFVVVSLPFLTFFPLHRTTCLPSIGWEYSFSPPPLRRGQRLPGCADCRPSFPLPPVLSFLVDVASFTFLHRCFFPVPRRRVGLRRWRRELELSILQRNLFAVLSFASVVNASTLTRRCPLPSLRFVPSTSTVGQCYKGQSRNEEAQPALPRGQRRRTGGSANGRSAC
jgi:hypothetical protein